METASDDPTEFGLLPMLALLGDGTPRTHGYLATRAGMGMVSAVTAIFLFDNDLNAGQGGYRTFRTAGPSFLNDLELVQPYDVFFVLTDRATSLAIPEFLLPEG